MQKGVFEEAGLHELVAAKRIGSHTNFSLDHINNASVDITIDGDVIYEVDLIAKPRNNKECIRDLLPLMGARPHAYHEPFRAGKTYLARSSINVNFPPGIYGYANPKSSSGRLFMYVRMLVDRVPAFDCADMRHTGLSGEVWLAIEPFCFDILPSVTERYTQLRIFDGDTRFSNSDLLELLQTEDILYRRDTQEAYAQGDLSMFTHDGSIQMTLAAQGDAPVGYVAKTANNMTRRLMPPINLETRDIDPREYFKPVYAEQRIKGDEHSWGVWLEAGEHYLLSTNEMLRVPRGNAILFQELHGRHSDATMHFAGFGDPLFFGTITLEVRAPRRVFFRNKSPVVTGVFEKMRKAAPPYTGSYQGQIGTKLPKQFLPYML